MMMMGGLPVVKDVALLFALGLGYMVLYFANKEQKGLRLIGYFVGSFILGLSIAYLLVGFLWQGECARQMMGHRYKMMQKMMQQPQQSVPAMPKRQVK